MSDEPPDPRASDILGPPQYPKGFGKANRKPGANRSVFPPFPNDLSSFGLSSFGLSNPHHAINHNKNNGEVSYNRDHDVNYVNDFYRPSNYNDALDFNAQNPGIMPFGFHSDSPLPSELFKSPVQVSVTETVDKQYEGREMGSGLLYSKSTDGISEQRQLFIEDVRKQTNTSEKSAQEEVRDQDTRVSHTDMAPESPAHEPALSSSSQTEPAVEPQQSPGNSGTSAKEVKVAPRSSTLYRIGPPFRPTTSVCPIYSGDEEVEACVQARFDRGFEQGDAGNWIGYKRNYFTLVSAFEFRGWDMLRFARGRFHVSRDGDKVPVRYFALALSVQCSDPGTEIALVQHTPKRDKGPKLATPVHPCVPGTGLPDHRTVQLSCNKRNGQKVEQMRKVFGFDPGAYMQAHRLSESVLLGYPAEAVKAARFERVQFTASLRAKPAAHSQKHFTVSVDLLAYLGNSDSSDSVVVARTCSAPLLVRGRSPSKYPVERTSGFRSEST